MPKITNKQRRQYLLHFFGYLHLHNTSTPRSTMPRVSWSLSYRITMLEWYGMVMLSELDEHFSVTGKETLYAIVKLPNN